MKIAMIGHKRIPSREGGVEIVVNELATRMAALGNNVCVYNRNCGEKRIKEYHGVRIYEVRTPKRSSLNAMVYSFFATLRAVFGRYDVIHYHAEGPCVMLALPHFLGIRTIATIHGLDWQRAKWGGFATKYLMLGEHNAAVYADEVIVLSKAVQDYFKEKYNRDTVFIANGLNKAIYKEPDIIKSKFGLNKRDYILFLARITPEKGLNYLIDAYKQLDTDLKLVIAGRCDPTTEYIESVKKKVAGDDRIIMTGFADAQLVGELFSNCYIYVLPSDIEGMPISLLEAVSYRARCLTSDIEENVQITGSYGLSFKKSDTDDLREKLEFAINHPQLYSNAFKPDKTAEETEKELDDIIGTYDWDRITEQTLDLYKKK